LQAIANVCAVEVVRPENFHQLPLDIYAPCALGAVLNAETIPQLNCPIVVGSANNQLEHQGRDGMLLLQKGIVYVPDFLANAGGLVNAVTELEQGTYNKQLVKDRTEQLYTVCSRVLHKVEQERRSAQEVAQELAVERIQSIKKTLAWPFKRT
jgi:leucine dehydrogenase